MKNLTAILLVSILPLSGCLENKRGGVTSSDQDIQAYTDPGNGSGDVGVNHDIALPPCETDDDCVKAGTCVCEDNSWVCHGTRCVDSLCQVVETQNVPCEDAYCGTNGCHYECMTNEHCDDGDPCTEDVCAVGYVLGMCEHTPTVCEEGMFCISEPSHTIATGCVECDLGSDCPEIDQCLGAICHIPDGSCIYETYLKDGVQCEAENGTEGICVDGACTTKCTQDAQCDDENPCTDDICQPSGLCHSTPISTIPKCDGAGCIYGEPSLADFDCDGSGCTLGDYCDEGVCISGSFGCESWDPCIEAECVDASETAYDHPVCHFTLTDPEATCVQTRKGQDEGGCITSSCHACETDTECDDGNSCTDDTCIDGLCNNAPLADHTLCGIQPTGQEMRCTSGECVFAPFGYCDSDSDCYSYGSYCVPHGEAEPQGFSGLCQECNPFETGTGPVDCPDGQTCEFGFIMGAYDEYEEVPHNRPHYYCE